MRRVIHNMGIPISIDIPGCVHQEIFDRCHQRLVEIDNRFSTYKSDSEVSRFNRGEVTTPSTEFRAVMTACDTSKTMTDGYFSPYYNGSYDPTGYVKGWAIDEISKLIRKHGHTTFLINAAGDITAASGGEKTWQIAIQNPFDRTATIANLQIKNGALATSGTYERGYHIYDPHTKRSVNQIISASVWGADIIKADVLATTIVAMGTQKAYDFMTKHADYHTLIVENDGTVHQI